MNYGIVQKASCFSNIRGFGTPLVLESTLSMRQVSVVHACYNKCVVYTEKMLRYPLLAESKGRDVQDLREESGIPDTNGVTKKKNDMTRVCIA